MENIIEDMENITEKDTVENIMVEDMENIMEEDTENIMEKEMENITEENIMVEDTEKEENIMLEDIIDLVVMLKELNVVNHFGKMEKGFLSDVQIIKDTSKKNTTSNFVSNKNGCHYIKTCTKRVSQKHKVYRKCSSTKKICPISRTVHNYWKKSVKRHCYSLYQCSKRSRNHKKISFKCKVLRSSCPVTKKKTLLLVKNKRFRLQKKKMLHKFL